jgi:hypothetical protein
MAKIKSTMLIGTALVTFEEEVKHKETLYIDVKIGSQLLCSISSWDKRKFVEDFKKLVKEYKV